MNFMEKDMKKLMSVALALSVLSWGRLAAEEAQPAAQAKSIVVEKLAFCTGVVDHEPQGEAASFASDIGKVYCWLKVTGAQTETKITLAWWYKDNLIVSYPLAIRSDSFRTWGTKAIGQDQTGEWTLKITDEEGQVLKEEKVTIMAAPKSE